MKLADKTVPTNPNKSIVVKNITPTSGNGRIYDVGIYKDHRLFVVEKDVHVGDQVNFVLRPKLYVALSLNMFVGRIFTDTDISLCMEVVDLAVH